MVPQPDGDSSKVKVKVRINVHGIFSVSSASLIEKQKGEAEDMQIDSEPMVQNEGRAEDQVRRYFWRANISSNDKRVFLSLFSWPVPCFLPVEINCQKFRAAVRRYILLFH